MKTRTLVANQLYFGLEPLILRRGAERTLERLAKQPPESARASVETLRDDFQLDTSATLKLLRVFVDKRLLEAEPGRKGDYRLTERFREFAAAKVVPPLPREEARQVLEGACELAAQLNAEGMRNPLLIDTMAVSGSYMSSSDKVGELVLWPVVRRRDHASKTSMTDTEGANEIKAALRALSPFIVVRIVADMSSVKRPFSVPFHADNEMAEPAAKASILLDWAESLRRNLAGR